MFENNVSYFSLNGNKCALSKGEFLYGGTYTTRFMVRQRADLVIFDTLIFRPTLAHLKKLCK